MIPDEESVAEAKEMIKKVQDGENLSEKSEDTEE